MGLQLQSLRAYQHYDIMQISKLERIKTESVLNEFAYS